jgi:hypothetical protein
MLGLTKFGKVVESPLQCFPNLISNFAYGGIFKHAK